MPTCRFLLLFSLVWARLIALDVIIDPMTGFRKIAAIRVSFQPDDSQGTTGDGTFLLAQNTVSCGNYTIDRSPHDKSYFESQLQAVDSYFRNVSNGHYGIDLDSSQVFPDGEAASYLLDHTMDYYHPYGETNEIYEQKLVELFRDALFTADSADAVPFTDYDLIVVFHAGIGQDFSLPFLDPTPEDIPSTYVDREMLGDPIFDVEHGIILPETQNHLLFEEAEDIFTDPAESCDYQFGLTGTFALMVGFAEGLPPLWDTETGESGIGVFGLMDQGSNNGRGIIPSPPDAWTRIQAGWTIPSTVTPSSEVLLPARSTQDSIIKVQIDDDEYFLIENRNNWFRNNVNIDSVRYAMYDNADDYPDYVEVLFDSVDIEFDENGVVTSVSSYDLGLPASGLLIWHIDESVIRTAPDEYSINADRERKGIDLEEADGAQDIGYPNIHLFTDPTSGYFGDMWFDGNLEYETVNGVGPPEFGPYSYPDTKSNDGASTFLSIENISVPGDTISFTVLNTFMVDGFPDTTAFIRTVYDLNGDGVNEVFGGKDSLWWASSDDLSESNRTYFYDELDTDNIFIGLDQQNDSIIVFMDSENFVVYNTAGTPDSLSLEEWENHQKKVFVSINGLKDSILLEEINSKWTGINFGYIAGIDINLDAYLDIFALNVDGFLYSYNSDLILLAGFPLDIQLQPPILSRDLLDDSHPEIVARSADSTSLYVFDYQGRIQYQFASRKDDELVAVENIDEKNSILTRFSIYQLGNSTETKGNEWAFEHGDWGRGRTVSLNYSVDFSGENLLTRAYCYPNPIRNNSGTLRVESVNAEKIEVRLYDLAGYFVDTFTKDSFTSENQISEWGWDVSDVESGVYFANVTVNNGEKSETTILKIAVIH
jgi:hypothetical protein